MKTKFNTLAIIFMCCVTLLLLACHKKKFHPDACFTVANSVMLLGDTVRITFCSDAKISRDSKWDMGDGTEYGGGAIPKHVYQTQGTFTIKLISTEHVEGVSLHWQKRAVSETQQTVTVQ